MSVAAAHERPQALERAPGRRRLPAGLGLAIGAAASLAMWAGIAWAAMRLIG